MKNFVLSALAALLLSATVNAQSTVDSIAAKYKLVPMPEALTIEKTFPVLGSYQLNLPPAPAVSGTTTTATTGTTTTSTDATTSTVSTDAAAPSTVTITLDSANKGLVWVEGLPQGKFKAYLKKSPATYRITAQKTEAGIDIPEGTLMLDPATQTLNIALGKAFDDVDPAAVFAAMNAATPTSDEVEVKVKTSKSKSKAKLTYYTATKIGATTTDAAAPATDATQQQPAQQQNQQ